MEEVLDWYNPTFMISGMALGIDTLWAKLAIERDTPLIAAIPFNGQESVWPKESRDLYHELLKQAYEIVVIGGDGYSKEKMQKRNEWMVDNCDVLVAVTDDSPGGTANCIKYAKSKKKYIEWIKF